MRFRMLRQEKRKIMERQIAETQPSVGEEGCANHRHARRHASGSNLHKKSKATHSQWQDNTVTVTMRNIPPHYTQQQLADELHRRGYEGCFHYLYLPYNFHLNINMGYASINFAKPKYALKLYLDLDGQCLTKHMRQNGEFIHVHPA